MTAIGAAPSFSPESKHFQKCFVWTDQAGRNFKSRIVLSMLIVYKIYVEKLKGAFFVLNVWQVFSVSWFWMHHWKSKPHFAPTQLFVTRNEKHLSIGLETSYVLLSIETGDVDKFWFTQRSCARALGRATFVRAILKCCVVSLDTLQESLDWPHKWAGIISKHSCDFKIYSLS